MDKKMFLDASYVIFEQAKKLRADSTHAEDMLWQYLKQKPLGYKFRRQHPLKTFIVDFYCHALKLVIEVDGDVHSDRRVAQYDKDRQEYLESQGLNFLRFTNERVEKNMASVMVKIEKYIAERSSSNNKSA